MSNDPERDLVAICDLVKHPGWVLVCERFDKGLNEMRDLAMGPDTEDVLATRIRHAHAAAKVLHPVELAGTLEKKLRREATHAADADKAKEK
ncbi:hypothetical protein [Geminisphaera colitermitum]|uniref:hypothetical protein n=1 Tax=Geminisphaera colitermitum TaxID=1148786 RepID=UPI000158C821|nr:hypothetical protein [Geminisphaera colitermitum]